MYDDLVKRLRRYVEIERSEHHGAELEAEVADAIEELSKRIDRAVELYNSGVERSAVYEVLVGIALEPPKEEA